MWCLAPVAIDINGQWTHLGLGLGEEEYPERRKNREPRGGNRWGGGADLGRGRGSRSVKLSLFLRLARGSTTILSTIVAGWVSGRGLEKKGWGLSSDKWMGWGKG